MAARLGLAREIDERRGDVACTDALGAELIPSPTAPGDLTRRFGEADVIGLMEAIDAVRPQLWEGRGLLGPVAHVDGGGQRLRARNAGAKHVRVVRLWSCEVRGGTASHADIGRTRDPGRCKRESRRRGSSTAFPHTVQPGAIATRGFEQRAIGPAVTDRIGDRLPVLD